LFKAEYKDIDNLVTWMLTFGDKEELLEPKEAREKIRKIVEVMERNYS
jgi:predicted DNA-binding transcriptional regulator YafY